MLLIIDFCDFKETNKANSNIPVFVQTEGCDPAAFDSLVSNSLTRPCSANGAGSTPRRVNLEP